MAVTIKLLCRDHSEIALDLICNEFSSHSVLHRSQHISPSEYRDYLITDWHNYAHGKESISLVACDDNSGIIEGCLIAIPFRHNLPAINSLPEKHQPIASLLRSLEEFYELPDYCSVRNVLLVDLAVVRYESRRRGIYLQLRQEIHRLAKERGYRIVLGALSSAETQSFCIGKMQQNLIAQIPYASFTFKNRVPFAAIEKPESIVLVEHCLDDA